MTTEGVTASSAQLLSVNELVSLVPGSTRTVWLRDWIPALRSSRVLVKHGRKFLGRPTEIVSTLMVPAKGAR